jgi:hypothetical protein
MPTDYPLLEVSEIRLDGVVLDASAYRVENSKFIRRIDGQYWPYINSFAIPQMAGHEQEIQVDITVGRDVPIELKMACADLACELKKACNSDESCTLPPHVRSIARRGVDIQIDDITSLFKDGLFGIPTIDMAIRTHGNCARGGSVFDATKPHRGYGVS